MRVYFQSSFHLHENISIRRFYPNNCNKSIVEKVDSSHLFLFLLIITQYYTHIFDQ